MDLRWATSDTDLDMHNASFRDAVADVCAPIHGVAKDDLESEDVRLHRRARRLARAGAATLAALLALTLAFGIDVVHEKNVVSHQALLTSVQGAEAEAQNLSAKQPDVSLLLASAATRLDNDPETKAGLLDATATSPHLVRMFRVPGVVRTGALTPDGHRLALVTDQGLLEIGSTSNPASGLHVRVTDGSAITGLEFSSDGRTLATFGSDGAIHLIDATTGHSLFSTMRDPQAPGPISAAVFSPDGRTLASISGWGDILLWNVESGSLTRRIVRSRYVIPSSPDLAFSPDGSHLLISSSPIEVYDLGTGTMATFNGVPDPKYSDPTHPGDTPNSIAYRPDGSEVAVASDKVISFHNAVTGQEVRRYEGGADLIRYAPDGKWIAAAHTDGSIEVLPTNLPGTDITPTSAQTSDLIGHDRTVDFLEFSSNSRTLLSAAAGEVGIWDVAGPASLHTELSGDRSGVNGVAYNASGTRVAVGRLNGTVAFWDPRTGQRIGGDVTIGSRGVLGVVGVAFSPNGSVLAVGGDDGKISAIDVQTHKILRTVQVTHPASAIWTPTEGVYQVAYSPDGRTLAAGIGNSTVVLIDARTWTVERSLDTGDTGVTLGVTFNPRGTLLAASTCYVGDRLGTAVFDLRTGGIVWSQRAVKGSTGVAFTPNGSTLAVALFSGPTLRVDTTNWRSEGAPLDAGAGYVVGIAYSPDGRELAEGTQNGFTNLWDLTSVTPVLAELGHASDRVTDVAFSPDGDQLLAGSSDATVSLWNVDETAWARRACVMAGRNLTQTEWHQYLGTEPYQRLCSSFP